jgi:hypothetical protein
MLRLSIKTKLEPLEALDRAGKYFEKNGLTLIETIAHLHGQGGFAEIRVSSGKLTGKAEYDSKVVLDELTKTTEDKFGFMPVNFSLHFHTTVGYVDVNVSNEKPVEVTLETMEYEYQVKEFADSLPKA